MSKNEVDSQIDYGTYLLKLKHLRDRDLPFSAVDEDSCTAEGGVWRTIKGHMSASKKVKRWSNLLSVRLERSWSPRVNRKV